MTIDQLKRHFEEEAKLFIFSAIVHADAIQDSLFKYYVMKKLLGAPCLAQGFGKEDLVLLVEGFALALPESHMMDMILSMKLLEERNQRYFLKESISIEDLYKAGGRKFPRTLRDTRIQVTKLKEWFVDDKPHRSLPTPRRIRKAILKGLCWLHWTITEVERSGGQVRGLPPFWNCGDGVDEPLGYLTAGTSNGDTLEALVDSYYYDCSYERCNLPDKGKTLSAVLRFLLNCQVPQSFQSEVSQFSLEQHAWNKGGFMAYDDQPKAFHPTVDATWDGVTALSSVYDLYDRLTAAYGAFEISKEALGQRLVLAIEFLLRMQLPDGGWGIYRYQHDSSQVYPYEFTTAYTVIALCLTRLGDVYNEQNRPDLYKDVEKALHRTFEFLKAKRQRFGSLGVWTPFFDSSPENRFISEILKCTAWTCSGLLALYRQFEELRGDIRPMLKDFIELADQNWTPNYRRRADVEFRVPLENNLQDTYNSWKNRLDTTLVILLLDLHNEGREAGEPALALTEKLWDRIEETVANVLHEQHPEHGHWNEPVDNQPLAAATLMSLQALHYYLKAMKGMLQGCDDSTTA